MKFIRFLFRFFISLIIAVLIICIGLWVSGNSHLIKAIRSTYLVGKAGPTIDDYSKFENRKVASSSEQAWPLSRHYNQYLLEKSNWSSEIEKWQTTALLVIHRDSILFEKYWNQYSDTSLTNSFSMAKSFTSLAIGAALKEGSIKSVKQKVHEFLPSFNTAEKADISIEDLLTMSSGIDFGESYGDPFGFMAKTYYGSDLFDLTVSKEVNQKHGAIWKYQGGNTLLLSFILQKATGQPLADYFSKNFWQPIGAKKDALWSLNEKNGIEKSYCCFYSNARDFARIGLLMLDSGKWKGKELIEKDFYLNTLKPVNKVNESNVLIDYYGYHWWLAADQPTPFYYARGIQGQYIVWIPSLDAVIVRLGHLRDKARDAKIPADLFTYIDFAKEVISKKQ